MALGTYLELKTAVADWLHRTDLTSSIPTFVALAESDIRRDVRCRQMEASETGTLTSATVALPTLFAEVRRVILDDRVQTYVTPNAFHAIDSDTSDRYTIVGSNLTFQATSGDYQLDYWAWFAELSDDADTNWLLTYHPGIYLFGSLKYAADFVGKNAAGFDISYQRAVARLRSSEQQFGGPLAVRPEVFY